MRCLVEEGDALVQQAERLGAPALLPEVNQRRRFDEQRSTYQAAVGKYRTAMRRSSRVDPQLYGKMARSLVRMHAWDACLVQCDKALEHFPRSSRLWFYVGLCHLGQHRGPQAADAFDKALECAADRGVDQILVSK